MPANVTEGPLREIVDVLATSAALFCLLLWLRQTRARLALVGTALLAAAYGAARLGGLVLTEWALQAALAIAGILVVVAFHADLQRGLERVALALVGRGGADGVAQGLRRTLVQACLELAAARRGALLVLPGRESAERHVEGGIELDGAVSVPLLLSLFDPNSPGHDGAAIVSGGRIARFGVHLPLSANLAALSSRGTRHAAGLGLVERCDAVVIVVSEERGSVSLGRAGHLFEVEASGLDRVLAAMLAEEPSPPSVASRARGWVRATWREAVAAIAVSVALWVAVVPGSTVTEAVVRVPVAVQDLPPGYVLEKVEPEAVEATVSGPRRSLLLAAPTDFELDLDAILVKLGRRRFEADAGDVKHPRGVSILSIRPDHVVLTLREPGPDAAR